MEKILKMMNIIVKFRFMLLIYYFLLFFLIQVSDELKEKIPPCPASPNCVNSVYTADKDHYLKPIAIREDAESTWKKLLQLLKEDKYAKITQQDDNFIRSEFKIPVFGFVDDVVFYLDQKNNFIHFRSASRVGQYDFGVNKNRIKKIRKRLNK